MDDRSDGRTDDFTDNFRDDLTPSPEMHLLCVVLGSTGSKTCVEAERPLAREIDWDVLLRSAAWHGVTPLLARRLRERGLTDLLPGAAHRTLQRTTFDRSARTLSQIAALGQVQETFRNAGIDALAWKGPALSMALYGEATLRESSDLDWLIRTQDLPKAVDVLASIGFTAVAPHPHRKPALRLRRNHAEIQMTRSRDRMHLELHDEILPRVFGRRQPLERCLERAVWTCLERRIFLRTLCPGDLLVSLCAHGAKHGWERLKWVCDIAAFMARHRHDTGWDAVLRNASQTGLSLPLLTGALLARRLLGAWLPEPWKANSPLLARAEANSLEAARRLAGGTLHSPPAPCLRGIGMKLMSTSSLRAKYLARRLITLNASDFDAARLPERLHLLYYPVRMARLTAKALRLSTGPRG